MPDEIIYYHSRADLVDTADGKSNVEIELGKRSKVGHTHQSSDINQDSDHRFISDDEKEMLFDQGVYTNSNKVPVTLGGIESGRTFDNIAIKSIMTDLLYPYTPPEKRLTVVPNGGIYEKGSAVDINNISVNIVPKTDKVNKIQIDVNGVIFNDNFTATFDNIDKYYTYTAGEARITSDAVVKAIVTEASGKTSSAISSDFKFIYPIYSGAINNDAEINQSTVKSTTKYIESKGDKITKTFNCKYQKVLFAYPESYGSLTRIDDEHGFNILSTFSKTVVMITCLDGLNINYNVYTNDASTISNFGITFFFV